MVRLEISLSGGRSYPIEICQGGLQGLGASVVQNLGPLGRLHLVTNPVVGALYLSEALESLRGAGLDVEIHEVPDGEAYKTVQTWEDLVEGLLAAGIGRRDVVLALGGGVTGDLAGFASSSVLRGVRCVQVPTTLLAMVDSAVGGKTGVNGRHGKNLIGAFHQPSLVYSALGVLGTLDDAEWRCGLGEVVKHGMIADSSIFELCEQNPRLVLDREASVVSQLVEKSCAVKASVVAEDEKESGWRRILNFGHTAGHAVESALGHGRLRHGECVAVGMRAETAWAVDKGLCGEDVLERLSGVLSSLRMCQEIPFVREQDLHRAVGVDKKREGGTIELAMPVRLGQVRLHRLPMSEVTKMLDWVPVAGEE
jgi:3-dehydroquinate synthase